MRSALIAMTLTSLTAGGLAMQPVAAQEATAQPARYSVATTPAGTLIDDPATAEILKKLIPAIWANDLFQSMGRELTLKGIQQYEGSLTDEKLAEIQAELDKIPVKE